MYTVLKSIKFFNNRKYISPVLATLRINISPMVGKGSILSVIVGKKQKLELVLLFDLSVATRIHELACIADFAS